MKSVSSVRRQQRALRELIDQSEDLTEQRIAYAMECALLYVLRKPGEEPRNLVTEALINAEYHREQAHA